MSIILSDEKDIFEYCSKYEHAYVEYHAIEGEDWEQCEEIGMKLIDSGEDVDMQYRRYKIDNRVWIWILKGAEIVKLELHMTMEDLNCLLNQ